MLKLMSVHYQCQCVIDARVAECTWFITTPHVCWRSDHIKWLVLQVHPYGFCRLCYCHHLLLLSPENWSLGG